MSRLAEKPRVALAVILTIALALRVAVAVDGVDAERATDPADYARHAHSIADGRGFPDTLIAAPGSPTAMRPPSLPYLLGGAEALTGNGDLVPLLVQALLGVLSVALIFLVARLLWGTAAGLIGAALAALFAPLVVIGAVPLSETLFIPLELAALALALMARDRQKPNLGLALATGAVCGAAALTRQAGAFFVIPVLAAYFTAGWQRRDAAVAGLVVLVAAALTIAPWTIRNQQEFNRFIPVALQDGLLFSGTYNEVAAEDDLLPAGWHPPTQVPELRKLFFRPGIDEAELNDRLGAAGREYLLDNPDYAIRATGLNALRMAGVGPGSTVLNNGAFNEMGTDESLRGLVRISILLLMAGALLGAARLIRARSGPWFVWVFPIILFSVTAPITGALRYRTPLDPFLILLAVAGLMSLVSKSSPRPKAPVTKTCGSEV